MSDPKKLFIKTYGCQMNVYDSERMAEAMAPEGYIATEDASEADLVLLNTCHIREKAGDKLYSDLGRLRPLPRGETRWLGGAYGTRSPFQLIILFSALKKKKKMRPYAHLFYFLNAPIFLCVFKFGLRV